MSLWSAAEAARATGGAARGDWTASGVSIDTRTLAPGDLFVALAAARDGHDFVSAALAGGAAAALVSRMPSDVAADAPLLLVDDVQAALEALGRAGRARFGGRVLAITGSVGKTTAKEMARTAFGAQMRVHAAEASYNNHWGVPLTLARMPPDTDLAVIEIGMNRPGEIAPLSRLARPHAAIVTTVAAAHLEAFDDLDGIAREKASIFEGLEPDGTAILNADLATTPILRAAAPGPVLAFGESAGADLRVERVELLDETTVVHARQGGTALLFKIGGAGRHLALNAAAIVAAATPLGADPDVTAQALAGWSPAPGRGTRERIVLDAVEDHHIDLIDDAFNANPASMAAALERLAAIAVAPGGRRVAVLGDMLELGPDEIRLHAALAAHPGMGAIDTVHAAGPRIRAAFEALPPARRGEWHETAEDLAARIGHLLRPGDVVLVKGSKSARTARVVDAIRKLGHRSRPPALKDA